MTIMIRTAKVEDFESIYSLNRDGLGYEFDMEMTRKRLKSILENPNNRIFIAESDGSVIGYVHAADYDCTYSEPLKNILAIAVDGGKRGLGAGRGLLNAVEIWAKETGAAGIRLVSSFGRDNAHQFYLACGYAHRKNQKNFIKLFVE